MIDLFTALQNITDLLTNVPEMPPRAFIFLQYILGEINHILGAIF